jgi:hypothetical protein
MNENIDYQALAHALLGEQARRKEVSSTPSSIYGHGPGGLFSSPGLSRPLFSAMILPVSGLQSILPTRSTNETNPLFGIITGVTATTGSEPTGVCDDPKTAGVSKLCTHSFVFGRFSRQTRVFDIDRAGRVTNRGEFMDLTLMNNPFMVPGTQTNVPSAPGMNAQQLAQNEVAKALFELAVSWSRDFARTLYTGNPSNNTAGGGYKEFYGMETLVNDGYRDAETGALCAAADSIVRSFGSLNVASNAAALARTLTNMYRNLKFIANRSGLDPVKWCLTMPFGLFYEITEVWPINYMTYRATSIPTGSTNFVNSADVEKLRDEMRGDLYNNNGQFLLIDGQKIPVVIDSAVPEVATGVGSYLSDIYFVPLTVLGGQPVTYMEHFNYDTPGGAIEMARQFAPGDSYYTSDGGRFLWHKKPPTNFCVQVLAKTEPRLMLLTPYVAARLSNVGYFPVEHERSPFTDAYYWVDGGKTAGDAYAPSYYSPTDHQR